MTRLALTAIAFAVLAASAHAAPGDYTQILCANPDTGRGLGAESVDGLTTAATVPSWRPVLGDGQCAHGPVTPESAIRLEPRASQGVGDGDYAALRYRVADPAISLRSARYFRAFRATSHGGHSTYVVEHGGENPAPWTISREDGQQAVPEHTHGRFDVPFSQDNEFSAAHDGRRFSITAICRIFECWHDAGEWSYSFFGAKAALHDAHAPVARDVTGPLADGTLRSTATLRYEATDDGAGLYRFRLWIDGVEHSPRVLPGDDCRDVNDQNADPYEFATQQPCLPYLLRIEHVDTTSLADGPHRIRAVVEDAGGNQTELVDRIAVVANNAPAAATSPPAAPAVAAAPQPAPLTAAAPPAFTAVAPAFPGARITIGVGPRRSATLRTSYTARVAVHGRLVDANGRPIAGRPVALVARDAAPGADERAVATATTRADGTFTATLPPGASRTITASFEHARATAKLTVPAAVTLTVGRARVGRPTPLTGLLSHHRRAGVLIQVQALDGRTWRTFDTTKTRADGGYRYAYRFKRAARGRVFALRVLVDSPAYPFAVGMSKPVRVRVA